MSLDESQVNPMSFDISKTSRLVCKCGNHTFVHAVFLREVSALISPSGKAGVVPIPTFVCNACGAVPERVVPGFIKQEAGASAPPASSLITNESPVAPPESPVPATPTLRKGNLTLLSE